MDMGDISAIQATLKKLRKRVGGRRKYGDIWLQLALKLDVMPDAIWKNSGYFASNRVGGALWGVTIKEKQYHSWDTMSNSVKYPIIKLDSGEIVADK
jgi:hypothetical protein